MKYGGFKHGVKPQGALSKRRILSAERRLYRGDSIEKVSNMIGDKISDIDIGSGMVTVFCLDPPLLKTIFYTSFILQVIAVVRSFESCHGNSSANFFGWDRVVAFHAYLECSSFLVIEDHSWSWSSKHWILQFVSAVCVNPGSPSILLYQLYVVLGWWGT